MNIDKMEPGELMDALMVAEVLQEKLFDQYGYQAWRSDHDEEKRAFYQDNAALIWITENGSAREWQPHKRIVDALPLLDHIKQDREVVEIILNIMTKEAPPYACQIFLIDTSVQRLYDKRTVGRGMTMEAAICRAVYKYRKGITE